MTEDVIECYDTFITKGFTDDFISGDFNDQPIPPDYYNFLNDYDEDGNNNIGTPVDDVLPENKGVEDAVMKNYEYIKNEIIIDDNDSLASYIEPPKTKG